MINIAMHLAQAMKIRHLPLKKAWQAIRNCMKTMQGNTNMWSNQALKQQIDVIVVQDRSKQQRPKQQNPASFRACANYLLAQTKVMGCALGAKGKIFYF